MKKGFRFTRDWAGLTAVVMGNGTSVEGMDLSILDQPHVRVCVANGGYRRYPRAAQLMCSDRHWLKANSHDLTDFLGATIVVTRPEAVVKDDPRMVVVGRQFIEKVNGDIFGNPGILTEGHNSTTTNISACVLRGVSRIVLLGVDLKTGPNNKRRAEETLLDNPALAVERYARQVRHISKQAYWVKQRGIEVFNCSPKSELECYPYITLEDALNV
jgi:hypothetical protein